jgi:hypothetical protein
MHDESWFKIFSDYNIETHDFTAQPYYLSAEQIKKSVQGFERTGEKEVRILCKQDSRDQRPEIFKKLGLFILPVTNGKYAIVKGEGYVDIPEVGSTMKSYSSKLDFELETSRVGDSEMQHLDFAYASSLIRTFFEDNSLVLTIRGRKYTPNFDFFVNGQKISVKGVQTEVDAGYEGKDKVILIEAKNKRPNNTIIRQLYYPFRQWQSYTDKKVIPALFVKDGDTYLIWQFEFGNPEDYNSISLIKSGIFEFK